MNLLLRRLRAGATGGGGPVDNYPTTFAGRVSTLGLVATDALYLNSAGAKEDWLYDIDPASSVALAYTVLDNVNLWIDKSKATKFQTSGVHCINGGKLMGGSLTDPLTAAQILVDGAPPSGRVLGPTHNVNTPYGVTQTSTYRSIMIEDGAGLELYGWAPVVVNTTLAARHAQVGDTFIEVVGDCRDWRNNDRIAIGITDLLQSLTQTNRTEEYLVSGTPTYNAGTNISTVNLQSAISFFRWGKLQYATGAGISLTNDGFNGPQMRTYALSVSDPRCSENGGYMTSGDWVTEAASINTLIAAGTPSSWDQRAPVSHFTRGLKFGAPLDTYMTGEEQFGGVIMKMGRTGTRICSGMEFVNIGHGGELGGYPIHDHLSSFSGSTFLGAVAAGSHRISKCSFTKSWNRGTTAHAIHGQECEDNCYRNILGHVLFQEDGTEKFGTWRRNFVYDFRSPSTTPSASPTLAPRGYQLKVHDGRAVGLWCTNPNYTVEGNRFSDGPIGMWLILGTTPFGASGGAAIYPSYEPILSWNNNTAHSCYYDGSRFFMDLADESGNFGSGGGPDSRVGGVSGGAMIASLFEAEFLWKNNGSGSVNEFGQGLATGNHVNTVSKPHYLRWTLADSLGQSFSGNTNADPDNQLLQHCLFAQTTLNAETVQTTTSLACNGAASYHGSLPIIDNLVFNYLPRTPRFNSSNHYGKLESDGFLSNWDLYINPIETLGITNTGNHYINSSAMWRTPGPGLIRHTTTYAAWKTASQQDTLNAVVRDAWLSPVVADWDGSLGQVGKAKSFIIFDQPFLTNGLADLVSVPTWNGLASFNKVTQTPMWGMEVWRMPGIPQTALPRASNPYRATSLPAGYERYAGGINCKRLNPTTLAEIAGTDFVNGLAGNNDGWSNFAGSLGSWVSVSTGLANESGTSGAAAFIGIDIFGLWRTVTGGASADDWQGLRLDWPGGSAPSSVYIQPGSTRNTPAADQLLTSMSKSALLALTGTACGYWQDTANNFLYIRAAWMSPTGNWGYPDVSDSANWISTAHPITVGVFP